MSVQRSSAGEKREALISPATASFLRRLNVLLASYAGVDRIMMIAQVRLEGFAEAMQ